MKQCISILDIVKWLCKSYTQEGGCTLRPPTLISPWNRSVFLNVNYKSVLNLKPIFILGLRTNVAYLRSREEKPKCREGWVSNPSLTLCGRRGLTRYQDYRIFTFKHLTVRTYLNLVLDFIKQLNCTCCIELRGLLNYQKDPYHYIWWRKSGIKFTNLRQVIRGILVETDCWNI